jgi:hypothetical protein
MLKKQLFDLRGPGLGCRVVLGILALGFVTLQASPAGAGTLDMIVESTTAAPSSLAQFDIVLQNNSASAVNIAFFSVDVLLSSTTDVFFTAIDNGTVAPYIFSITGSFPPGFTSQNLGMEASGNDLSNTFQVLNPGDTFGLAHVTYVVNPSATLGDVVNLTLISSSMSSLPPPNGTELTDPTGAQVPFNTVNGTITIAGPAVPEPASVTLLGIGGAVLLAGTRFGCRRVSPRPDRV